MKKIITIIAFALLTITMSAKEVSRNNTTGTILDETAGIYSLISKGGVIILGDVKAANKFMTEANKCFAQEKLKNTFDVGEQSYTVGKDDTGLYITKIGLGVVKIRPSDSMQFGMWLTSHITKDKAKKVWNVIKE